METRPPTYSKLALTLGGVVFGLYYTCCLFYFEAFSCEAFVGPGLCDAAQWVPIYLPVAAILVLASVGLGRMLFGELRLGAAPRTAWFRRLVISFVFFAMTWSALAIYGVAIIVDMREMGHFLMQLVLFMLLIGLLPLQAALVILPKPKLPKSNLPEAEAPEPALPAPMDAPPAWLVVEASQGEAPFKVAIAELIAVEAADNYCKFHFLKDGQHKTKLLRMTMKEAEEALPSAPHFYRCHRSFLVNGGMVEEVLGNSQAYRLKLMHLEEAVPVSRAFDIEPLRK
jgi:DNA-binding LytR/AlgR family response regulator